jgi:hypothetical protein
VHPNGLCATPDFVQRLFAAGVRLRIVIAGAGSQMFSFWTSGSVRGESGGYLGAGMRSVGKRDV